MGEKSEVAKRDFDPVFKTWIHKNIPILITAGRLVEAKGHEYLIRSFSKVRKNKVCKLVVLGQGPLEGRLKSLVKDLHLNEEVLFPGFQKNPYAYFSESEIFVLSSLHEGFGKVLVEAMACGLPIISTDCRSGPREILAPRTNFLTEAKDIEIAEYGRLTPVPVGSCKGGREELTKEESLLASAMLCMLEDKKLRGDLHKKSVERAKSFDISKCVEKWLECLGIGVCENI